MKDEFATGRSGIEILPQAPEADAMGGEVPHRFHQVGQRASQTVELPDDQHIPGSAVVQGVGESWPLRLGAAGDIGEQALASAGQKGIFLEVEILLGGGNSGISDQHDGLPGISATDTTKLNCQDKLGTLIS